MVSDTQLATPTSVNKQLKVNYQGKVIDRFNKISVLRGLSRLRCPDLDFCGEKLEFSLIKCHPFLS